METATALNLKAMLFIEDGVQDLVKLSYQLDVETDKLRKTFDGLKKKGFVSSTGKDKVRLTKKGQAYLKKNKDKIEYC
ncbi:MAG: hypothetical protein HY512_03080 [Candidatus Aenigmarchaeota archaeon]|nr:hypothetical protein [Candidatus Aenigmarchaeota archaeon]